MRHFFYVLAVMTLLGGCSDDGDDAAANATSSGSTATITGTVDFRERVGLTPQSRLELVLQDVSLADMAAVEIATNVLENPGQAPIAFTIDYDAGLIDESHSYSVAAKVFDRDHLIFISDTINPVITRGASNEVTVQTVRVGSSKLEMPDLPLVGTAWVLKALGGGAVESNPDSPEPYMQATTESEIGGHGGCNRFSGSYNQTNGNIAIGNLAVTMMACPTSTDTEQAFLKALGDMDTIRIKGGTLIAYSDGAVVASFEAKVTP